MPSFKFFKEQSSNQHKERMKCNFLMKEKKMLKEIIITIIIFYVKLKSPSADRKRNELL